MAMRPEISVKNLMMQAFLTLGALRQEHLAG